MRDVCRWPLAARLVLNEKTVSSATPAKGGRATVNAETMSAMGRE